MLWRVEIIVIIIVIVIMILIVIDLHLCIFVVVSSRTGGELCHLQCFNLLHIGLIRVGESEQFVWRVDYFVVFGVIIIIIIVIIVVAHVVIIIIIVIILKHPITRV